MTSTILVVFTRIQALELETRADQPRYYESPGLIVDIPLHYSVLGGTTPTGVPKSNKIRVLIVTFTGIWLIS